MADLNGFVRWNANFVKGLAESVLNRARAIRNTLPASVSTAEDFAESKRSVKAAKAKASAAVKKASGKRALSVKNKRGPAKRK